ncbi:hypothetical protein BFP70_03485 [Thioclava sp. SK-1]|uniref:LacI family DNA-binding transcriptional regulator n=1 Tax=Thioclava sp. SK-1 TaxID=1889770 RepID=UPI000825378A|nr:LacI family DNA-binding transcriptional regulator [Thioclava sp. SK-1]OCX66902.1 hypothetical protein BFP70_03485 [Thioclava sp. SK-1]
MTSSGRTRISDIASRLGISTATVSRALTGKGYVRESLAAQIRSAAIDMNYAMPGTPPGQRVLLVSSQEAMIDFQRSQFTMYVLEGLQDRADSQDIQIDTHIYQADRGSSGLQDILDGGDLIGLLLVTVDDETLAFVRDLDLPAVLVNGDDPEMRLSSVTPCNRSAATLATRHLMQLGHRNILFLNKSGRRTIQRRLEGWRDALAQDYRPEFVVDVEDWTAEAAKDSINQVLASGLHFTAIVAAGDILAAGAMSALQAAKIDVPGQVSIIGIDGLPQGQYLSPALSSVMIPMKSVGAFSLDLLLETNRLRAAKMKTPARRVELACDLVARSSTGPAPR